MTFLLYVDAISYGSSRSLEVWILVVCHGLCWQTSADVGINMISRDRIRYSNCLHPWF